MHVITTAADHILDSDNGREVINQGAGAILHAENKGQINYFDKRDTLVKAGQRNQLNSMHEQGAGQVQRQELKTFLGEEQY